MEREIQLLQTLYKTKAVTVYKALRNGTDRVVKVFKIKSISEANSIKAEAHRMKAVDHPFIVDIEDCIFVGQGNSISEVWLVMEYFPKGDLQKLIRSRQNSPWSEQQLYNYFYQLIDALAYLESLNLAHRDIKPQNIFVTQSENLVVGDLGSLKVNSLQLHTIAGTPLYLSPLLRIHFMQYQGGLSGKTCQHDPIKSDVYSLGLTFLEMASLKGVEDLINLQKLSVTVYNRLCSLPYSNWAKELLNDMLQVEERCRPTFIELIQKYFNAYSRSLPKERKVCSNDLLLCSEPKVQDDCFNTALPPVYGNSDLFDCDYCRNQVEAAEIVGFNCSHGFCHDCCKANRKLMGTRRCLNCDSFLSGADFQEVIDLLSFRYRGSILQNEWNQIETKASRHLNFR